MQQSYKSSGNIFPGQYQRYILPIFFFLASTKEYTAYIPLNMCVHSLPYTGTHLKGMVGEWVNSLHTVLEVLFLYLHNGSGCKFTTYDLSLILLTSRWTLKFFWIYNWSSYYRDQFTWRKRQLWKANSITLYPYWTPSCSKLCPSQIAPLNHQALPKSELAMLPDPGILIARVKRGLVYGLVSAWDSIHWIQPFMGRGAVCEMWNCFLVWLQI